MGMDDALKQRLIGAAVLVAVGVIFIPMILDGPPDLGTETAALEIPPRPNRPVHTRVLPLEPAVGTQTDQQTDSRPAEGQTPAPTDPQTLGTNSGPTQDMPTDAVAGDLTTWWVVQVGSFKEEENAVAFRNRFREAGYTAFVEPVSEGDEPRYRVRLGPEQDRARAEAVRNDIKEKFDVDGLVLTDSS